MEILGYFHTTQTFVAYLHTEPCFYSLEFEPARQTRQQKLQHKHLPILLQWTAKKKIHLVDALGNAIKAFNKTLCGSMSGDEVVRNGVV